MDPLRYSVQLRWADMDPNFHLRHDAFYGIAAQARVEALVVSGFTSQRMQELHIGPILFREECIFKREIRLDEKVEVLIRMSKARADGSRWTFHHEFRRADGTVCATLITDGAWIDTEQRKLAIPPQDFAEDFLALPRTDDFELQPVPVPKQA
ncbi:MAG: acyl-CoA thioesterase [Flavobacteriales bacterium]